MKITNNTLIAALAGVVLSLFASSAQAQVKGGERMMQLNGSSFSPTVTPSDYKPMSCAKCQDVLTTVPDSAAKGGSGLMAQGAPTKTMVTHLCESCKTTVKVAQAGKNSPPDMVNHKCTSCGSENAACCNTTKSSDVATAGMDKK